MTTERGSGVRIDAPAALDALRRLGPVIAEIDSALGEIAGIATKVHNECAAHPSGTVFDVGHQKMIAASTTALEDLREALSAYTDDVRRAAVDLTAADAESAELLRGSGGGRC